MLVLLWAGMAWGQALQLPPGVRLDADANREKLPINVRADLFSVDWTNPLLRVRLVSGLPPGGDLPLPWSDSERKRPRALRIQLSEPVSKQINGPKPALTKEVWSLALPLAGMPQPGNPDATARRGAVEQGPHLAIAPLCPWLPGLASESDNPQSATHNPQSEWASPLASTGALAAVRWMGRRDDLNSLTSMSLAGRCLFSWTRPDTGRTRFALVARADGGALLIKDLEPWLSAQTGPGEWLAIHSQGPDARVGTAGWRLGGAGDPRRVERLGGAIELEGLAAGQSVDWARLPGATAQASSLEPGYGAENLILGLLWPSPFSPRVWISGETRAGNAPTWAEVDLLADRPVERIVVIWPTVAGWSEQFLPGRAVLKAGSNRRSEMVTLAELGVKELGGAQSFIYEYKFKQTASMRRVRIELPEPSRMPLDRRARLAGIQLWGPWDGKTGAK